MSITTNPSSARPAAARPAGLAVSGRDLRCLLTLALQHHGPLTVARLVEVVEQQGFAIAGRPSKAVSDALRWEIGRGRVVRLGRGRYAPSSIPGTTFRRILRRAAQLQTERLGSTARLDGRR